MGWGVFVYVRACSVPKIEEIEKKNSEGDYVEAKEKERKRKEVEEFYI